MNSAKYPYRVERISQPGSDFGQHKTEAAANKRIDFILKCSNGKHTREMYKVVNDAVQTKAKADVTKAAKVRGVGAR